VCNANSASATPVASQHQRRIGFRSPRGLSIRLFRYCGCWRPCTFQQGLAGVLCRVSGSLEGTTKHADCQCASSKRSQNRAPVSHQYKRGPRGVADWPSALHSAKSAKSFSNASPLGAEPQRRTICLIASPLAPQNFKIPLRSLSS
jgi:hypothetical protein